MTNVKPPKRKKKRDAAVMVAVQAVGNMTRLAKLVGRTKQAVSQWKRIPIEHVTAIEACTGIPRTVLRPDFNWNFPGALAKVSDAGEVAAPGNRPTPT